MADQERLLDEVDEWVPVSLGAAAPWVTEQGQAVDGTPMRVGDWIVGSYAGTRELTTESGERVAYHELMATSGSHGETGLVSLGSPYVLSRALVDAAIGDVIRVTILPSVDVGRPSPMRNFRVDRRR